MSKRQPARASLLLYVNPRKALEFSAVMTQLKEGFCADNMNLPPLQLSANSQLVFGLKTMKTELSKRQPRFIPALNPRRKALEFSGVITQLKEVYLLQSCQQILTLFFMT